MSSNDYLHGWAKERMKEAIEARERDVLSEQARAGVRHLRGSVIARVATFVMALFRV